MCFFAVWKLKTIPAMWWGIKEECVFVHLFGKFALSGTQDGFVCGVLQQRFKNKETHQMQKPDLEANMWRREGLLTPSTFRSCILHSPTMFLLGTKNLTRRDHVWTPRRRSRSAVETVHGKEQNERQTMKECTMCRLLLGVLKGAAQKSNGVGCAAPGSQSKT